MSEQPSMQDILKAVENMQSSMQDTQEKLANTKVTGSAATGDSNIQVELTGKFECDAVKLPEGFQTLDKAELEGLIASAINDAVEQVNDFTRNQIKHLSADLDQKNKE